MDIKNIKAKIESSDLVPFFGLGIFEGLKSNSGEPIPSSSDELILAMNNKRAMSPRMMIDYSRAAMSLEQKKGRAYIEKTVEQIFGEYFEMPKIVEEILKLQPKYIIDTNYDSKIEDFIENLEVIYGVARITAEYSRYIIYDKKAQEYTRKESLDFDKQILFKPLGSTKPTPSFVLSDADFVDWLTEAMGGFAMPKELKEYRKEKEYIFFGLPFNRDTERMVANELTLDLKGGYVVFEGELNKKSTQFLEKHNLEQIKYSPEEFAKKLASN